MHWFSILNSLMVVLVMSSIVAMIMMRTIRRDLQRYEGLLGDPGVLHKRLSFPGWQQQLSACVANHSLQPAALRGSPGGARWAAVWDSARGLTVLLYAQFRWGVLFVYCLVEGQASGTGQKLAWSAARWVQCGCMPQCYLAAERD